MALRRAHIRYVAVKNMLVLASDKRQSRRLIGYQDEDQLTAAIRRAVEGTPRRFYFLSDKSQIPGPEEDAPWTFLTRTFDSLNIKLIPKGISDLEKIPDDAAGVALIAPRFDLNTREIARVESRFRGNRTPTKESWSVCSLCINAIYELVSLG